MSRRSIAAFWLASLFLPGAALAVESTAPAVLGGGEVRGAMAAGPVVIDRELTFGLDLSLEVGLVDGLELAAPLALGVRLIEAGQGSALYLGIGVVDLMITPDGRLLYTPAGALAGKVRMGYEAALHLALDLTGVEEGSGQGEHPFWLRGAAAVIIDMGPYATIAAGVAYQRKAFGGETPEFTDLSGWAADSRFSFGAVRSQPFYDLPTLSVHATRMLDVILIARFDIDPETDSAATRVLLGLELKNRGALR